MPYFIGIDIGGTFTDAVVLDDKGALRMYKSPTTPDNPADGVNAAMRLAEEQLGLADGGLLADTDYFGLGTTVATNAFLERKGVLTGLITTRGFGDTLIMQRVRGQWAGLGERTRHYSIRKLPEPIVPRPLIREVTERIDYAGQEIAPLNEDDVRTSIAELLDAGVEAIAVCLLWSFRNPAHERRIGEIIADMAPDIFVTLSCDLVPVLGEYERTATTAMNAYLGPAVARYMNDLEGSLKERGLKGPFRIMDSGGGVMEPGIAASESVSILTSGPTGGVLASAGLARELGAKNVLTTDMGGTSFDVGMIVDGLPVITPSQEIARFHIIKPAVDVKAIGAGGGSIARVERGELRLGPQSAGAVPGPACYGHGGTNPTVTDADVVLGIIDPDFFLGGRLSLDETAARNAVESKIAKPLGISVDEAAMGIKKVADHQMADLLTTLTIGQGLDPREFTIFAYGGAGPTHCHAYGAHLGVEAVVVPSTAMVHSAYGAVASDLFRSAEVSDIMHTTPFAGGGAGLDAAAIGRIFEGLETQTGDSLKRSGIKRADISYTRFVDMRFRFQVNELIVPASSGPIDSAALDGLVTAFETIYEERYGEGSAFREGGVELVTFRIQARGQLPNPGLRKLGSNGKQPVASAGTREVRLPDFGAVEAAVYRGELLSPGAHIDGPAVIEHPGTTVVVGPGQRAEIDEWLNTIIKF